jgi:CheY-like chemotaxis protein
MSGATDRPTVLLVDDCVPQRDLYELMLESDFRVMTASRGLEALAIVSSQHPDVVVLDVMMPGMDGWETCTHLKDDPTTAETPVVLLTSVDDCDLSTRAVAAGATAVLTKPCPADRLTQTIQQVLGPQRKAVWS